MTITVKDLLAQAKAKLPTPGHFVADELSVDRRGNIVAPTDATAVRWSTLGALEAVGATGVVTGPVLTAAKRLVHEAAEKVHGKLLDAVEGQHGHAGVLAVFDAAIAAAQAKATQQQAQQGELLKKTNGNGGAKASEAKATEAQPPARREATPPTTTAPQITPAGIYRDLPTLLEAFDRMREQFNVCFPVMQPDLIPPLFSVAVRVVAIDNRLALNQYKQCVSADLYYDGRTGKYGLSKIARDKIAAAAGINWHPGFTSRTDDESEPFFRSYRATGIVLNLDGTQRIITDYATSDLRATTWDMKKRGDRDVRVVTAGGKTAVGMTEDQLEQARRFIDEICLSRAMNRVINRYAFLKGLYTKEELAKPFVIAALVLTGETDDPELRREFIKATAARVTGITSLLFGAPVADAAHQIADLGTRTRPPLLGTAIEENPDDDADHESDGSDEQVAYA